MLQVQNLSIRQTYNGRAPLVQNVSFDLQGNRFLTLVGETGSGKSLIAKALAGILPPGLEQEGKIKFNGRDFYGGIMNGAAKEIFLMPQESALALNPSMSILSQVAEVFRWPLGKGRFQSKKLAAKTLNLLGLSRTGQYPHQLSGGMSQRSMLAMALASPARLVIADEPTKGLDAGLKDEVVGLLAALTEKGKTVMCITHDFSVARKLGGLVAVMLKGKAIEQGPAEKMLSSPNHEYTRALINALPENGLISWNINPAGYNE